MSDKLSETPSGEVCQSCGCAYDTVYHVPDSIWARMLPEKAPAGLLCIPCAIRIAGEKGIPLWWQAEVDDYPTTALERSSAALREAGYRDAIEEAAKYVDEWALAYPTDVFIEPPPGEHGQTIDACHARALRDMLPRVAKAIRALPGRKAAGG